MVAVLEAGLRAFSPAHQPLVADEALVIDGTRAAVAGFDIGPEDSYGYLIEADEDTVGLGSSGPVPTLGLQARCSIIEQAMKRFARPFIQARRRPATWT